MRWITVKKFHHKAPYLFSSHSRELLPKNVQDSEHLAYCMSVISSYTAPPDISPLKFGSLSKFYCKIIFGCNYRWVNKDVLFLKAKFLFSSLSPPLELKIVYFNYSPLIRRNYYVFSRVRSTCYWNCPVVFNPSLFSKNHKLTNAGRIDLEQQVSGKQLTTPWFEIMDLLIPHQKHCALGYQSLLVSMLQLFLF